jgi:hypothetical protein
MAMATAAIGLQLAGAGSSAVGAFYGAKSRKSSLAYEADMADINAKLAESTAQSTLLAGQAAEQRTRLQTAQFKSRQRVAMGASGTALDEGSNAEILKTTDYMGEIDADTVAANAVRAAWGYRTQATNYKAGATMARSAADAVSPGAALATSLLGSASQVASSWYSAKKAGMFDTTSAGGAGTVSGGSGLKTNKLTGFWGS